MPRRTSGVRRPGCASASSSPKLNSGTIQPPCAISRRRLRRPATVTSSPTITSWGRIRIGRAACPARTPTNPRSWNPWCSSATWRPSRGASNSPRASSSFPSARPPWSPSRPPRSTCSAQVGCAWASGSGGTPSSISRWDRTFTPAASASRSRWRCCACCGHSRWSHSRASGSPSPTPGSIRSPFSARSRSGLAHRSTPRWSVPRAWRMAG